MKKSILLFIILSTVASAINYFAYPLFGRILPVSEYINITIALSLFTQITTFLSSITAITIGLTKDGKSDPKRIVTLLQSLLFRIFLVLIIIFLAVSPFVLPAINIPISYSAPIALMMLASLPITVASGYLNGKQLMAKLGALTVISASFQLLFGVTTALIFKDGFATLMSMSLAQICAISVIYYLYRKDDLPHPLDILSIKKDSVHTTAFIRKLILYTGIASIAIMFVNLTQIADLVIINAQSVTNAKFYTDLYIVSRVMFFAGMIFIWPFLGEIQLTNRLKNRTPFMKLVTVFCLIALIMIGTLFIAGPWLMHLLLGVWYSQQDIFVVGSLAIVFKLFLLVISSVTLYFMIFRNYTAVLYALLPCALLAVYAAVHGTTSITQTLIELNGIALGGSLVGVWLLMRHTKSGIKPH